MGAEFEIGDVVEGRFSARPERRQQAIVRGRVRWLWHGDRIAYEQGHGYGTWGYPGEVEAVLRQATEEDEQEAASVKRRVSADTDAMMGDPARHTHLRERCPECGVAPGQLHMTGCPASDACAASCSRRRERSRSVRRIWSSADRSLPRLAVEAEEWQTMSDRPLTGEVNTAEDAARRLLAIDEALHRHAEGTSAFKRTDVRLVCEALAECRQALAPFVTRGTGPDRPVRAPRWEVGGQYVVWLEKGEWERARAALGVEGPAER